MPRQVTTKVPGVEAAKILAENERLKSRILELEAQKSNGGKITFKIGELGSSKENPEPNTGVYNIRIYGFGVRPHTFYASQLMKLLSPEVVEEGRMLLEENAEILTWKKDGEPGEGAPETFPWTQEANGRRKAKG